MNKYLDLLKTLGLTSLFYHLSEMGEKCLLVSGDWSWSKAQHLHTDAQECELRHYCLAYQISKDTKEKINVILKRGWKNEHSDNCLECINWSFFFFLVNSSFLKGDLVLSIKIRQVLAMWLIIILPGKNILQKYISKWAKRYVKAYLLQHCFELETIWEAILERKRVSSLGTDMEGAHNLWREISNLQNSGCVMIQFIYF